MLHEETLATAVGVNASDNGPSQASAQGGGSPNLLFELRRINDAESPICHLNWGGYQQRLTPLVWKRTGAGAQGVLNYLIYDLIYPGLHVVLKALVTISACHAPH